MKKPNDDIDYESPALDSLLAAWAQSRELAPARAEAIRVAARQTPATAALPTGWWFAFAHNLTAVLTQASRSWSVPGEISAGIQDCRPAMLC
jgi:hypothetical protein